MEGVEFSCKKAGDQQNGAARKALHRHSQHRRAGHPTMLRIERSTSPSQGGEHQDAGAPGINALGTAKVPRTDQEQEPRKSHQQPQDDSWRRPHAAGRSQSTITSHSDTVATSNAVTPDGTVCSAQLTPPLPTKSSRKPVTTAVRQLAAVGRIPVFRRKTG